MSIQERTAFEPVTDADAWLIIKRDLYFLPDACGYTGIRDEAGRFSLNDAKGYCNPGGAVTIVRLADAPEFRKAAFSDLVIAHLIKQRDQARRNAIKECADKIGNLRQSEAGLINAKHSGQRGCDRSDALYDAYQAVMSLGKEGQP